MQCIIDVTHDDIERGDRADCENCAIALAIRRKADPGTYVSVHDETITFDDVEFMDLPLPIVTFINEFDSGAPVAPFSFWLDSDTVTIDMLPKE